MVWTLGTVDFETVIDSAFAGGCCVLWAGMVILVFDDDLLLFGFLEGVLFSLVELLKNFE